MPVDEVPALEVKGLRIAYAADFSGHSGGRRDHAMRSKHLARKLGRAGAIVEEASAAGSSISTPTWQAGGELIGMMLGAAQPEGRDKPPTWRDYFAALQQARPVDRRLGEFPGGWDALLCPASMTTAFPHCEPGTPIKVDGRDE